MKNILLTILFTLIGTHQSAYPVPKIEIIPVVKTARITCYSDFGRTASGEITRPGIVATSDRSIPMGTKVYIEDYGIMDIADKTAKRIHERGFTLDIYDLNCDKSFGVKIKTYKLL